MAKAMARPSELKRLKLLEALPPPAWNQVAVDDPVLAALLRIEKLLLVMLARQNNL